MCGIAGIISKKGFSPEVLFNMSQIQKHRGPDDEGFFIQTRVGEKKFFRSDDTIREKSALPHIKQYKNQDNFIGLAHRRLSIIDLSSAGHQPMQEISGSNVIVLNGEIYNYKELKNELENKGYKFRSTSDTEIVLASYREWGEGCVEKFVGMWAFAIYDADRDIVFLSRDRYGIKPLYFFEDDGKLIFASEIKSLLKTGYFKKEIEYENLKRFAVWGYYNEDSGSMFKGVRVVPAGSNLKIDLANGNKMIENYYNPESGNSLSENMSDEIALQEEFNRLFTQSVSIHLRSDVPVGSCLSGGLDSSAIVSLISEIIGDNKFNTFTAAFDFPGIDESGFAKRVTADLNNVNSFFTFPDSKIFWEDFGTFIWHQDLPVGSTSVFSQWEVMKLAHKKGMKVLLDGQGADEILGGYRNFSGFYLMELLKSVKFASFFKESLKLKSNRGIKLPQELMRAGFYFLPKVLKKFIRKNVRSGGNYFNFETAKEPDFYIGNFRDLSVFSIKHGLKQLLRYEDRNSMAFSIESRVPFLDHRLVEYSIGLPLNMKIREGWSKYVLRKNIRNKLDDEIVWRKGKLGFITPQRMWKNELSEKLNKYVSSRNIPDFLNKKSIEKSIRQNIKNKNELTAFWRIISIIKWIEVFDLN